MSKDAISGDAISGDVVSGDLVSEAKRLEKYVTVIIRELDSFIIFPQGKEKRLSKASPK
jgi:hypothetical protein